MNKPVALTIAGSDPTGGAGLQADLKTFAAHDVHGVSVVAVLTAQTARRFEVLPVDGGFVTAQINSVFEQFDVQAIKIGMLGNAETVTVVIEALDRHNGENSVPVVVDPVIRASNGGVALSGDAVCLLRDELLPRCSLIKPNIAEAAILLREDEATTIEQMQCQAASLVRLGCSNVLLSGGHLAGSRAVDILCTAGKIHQFSTQKFKIQDIHGTGCTLTSSITANLAKGHDLFAAVDLAKAYIAGLLQEETLLDRQGRARSLDHLALMKQQNQSLI